MNQNKAGQLDDYTRVCNELSAMNGIYATENMAMFSLVVAVIGLGWEFQSPFLLLLSFAVLILFQILLGGHLNTFLRDGAYLMVFHEADNNALSWESALEYFESLVPRDLKRFRFQRLGSSILGMIALACSITLIVQQYIQEDTVPVENAIILALTVFAEGTTIAVNLYYISGKRIKMRSDAYKRLFIEASILRDIRKDLKEHPGKSRFESLENVFSAAHHKFKQYPPLASDTILNCEVMRENLIKSLNGDTPAALETRTKSEPGDAGPT